MSRVYDYRDYDKHLSLKPDAGMWLVILYLMRPYIVLAASFRRGRGGGSDASAIRDMIYPDDFVLTLGILATIPALLFIVTWAKRVPGAGDRIRWLWSNGGHLLAIAAACNIVIVFVPLLTGIISRIHLAGWVQIGLSLFIIGYLYTSRRVKDTFADFPADEPPE